HHDIAVVVAVVAVFAAPHQVAAAVTVEGHQSIIRYLRVSRSCGFQFKPLKKAVELDQVKEYQDVVKAASHSMVYASLHELEVFLFDGVLHEWLGIFDMLSEPPELCEEVNFTAKKHTK
ncbi:hypothetical protein Tco_1141392, partial [Tanacetum coccineum]